MSNEESETVDPKTAEKNSKSGAGNHKPSSTFFDLGKARQTVYSILMGFVLKYFIEHVYENKDVILSLDKFHLFAYSGILVYFFLNCFRFLFGLVDYSNMADDKFAPQDDDWKWGNFRKNTEKLFVINTGIFQLMVFSFYVFYIFPHFDPDIENKADVFVEMMPSIINAFGFSTILLMLIDIRSLHLFKKHVEKKDFEQREKVQHNIWRWVAWIEFFLAVALLVSVYFSKPECATLLQNLFIGLLALSALFEGVAFYRYLELPIISFSDLFKRLKKVFNEWKNNEAL